MPAIGSIGGGSSTLPGTVAYTDQPNNFSVQQQFINGSVSTPAIAPSSTPNTGIYFTATTINFTIGGVNRGTFTTLGLQGVSTVTGAVNVSAPVFRFGSSSNPTGFFGSNASTGRLGAYVASSLVMDINPQAGLGSTKFLYIPLKAEAGFSAGRRQRVGTEFVYVGEGGFNPCDTSSAPVALTLADDILDPVTVDALEGSTLVFKDQGNAATNNITISTVDVDYGLGTTITINVNRGSVELVLEDGTWAIKGGWGYVVT